MSDRYESTIQLVKKVGRKNVRLDTWEILKPYMKWDENNRHPHSIPGSPDYYYRSYDFSSLFSKEEVNNYTTQFYWLIKGNDSVPGASAVAGVYSWHFPMEAMIRVLKAAGIENANRLNVRASSFRGGIK